MTKVVKNQPIRLEFGDYGNFATLTPIALGEFSYGSYAVTFKYADGRTIVLCIRPNELDIESFA